MNHKSRVVIHRYISAHPGISISQLSEIFDINYSTLKYHLRYLEKNNIIISRKEGRTRCYYPDPNTMVAPVMDLQVTINSLNPNQQRVIKIIQNRPGISKKDIIDYTRSNRKSMEYTLNKLIDKKLIWTIRNSEITGYEFITEEKLRYEILNQLLVRLLANEIDEGTFRLLKKKLEDMSFDELRAERID